MNITESRYVGLEDSDNIFYEYQMRAACHL